MIEKILTYDYGDNNSDVLRLLHPGHLTKTAEYSDELNSYIQELAKKDGQFVLKGLSVHRAENEEDALNLLFIGDTNRVVSETPKNDQSTRSHCIFIIQIEA